MLMTQGLILLAIGGIGAYALHRGVHWGLLRAFRAPRQPPEALPPDIKPHVRGVRLPTVGGKTLFGWYAPPPDAATAAPGLVAIHGWGGSADGLLPLARLVQAAGYGVLLLDARCHGRSDDDTFASLPRFAEDLAHGVAWMRTQPEIDPARIGVMGHSVGAGAALLTGHRHPDLAAVVSLAAFAHPEEVMRRTLAAWRVPYRPVGWAINRYVEHIIGHRFADIAPLTTVSRQHAPVLLLHGTADAVVPIEAMTRLHAAAQDAGGAVSAMPLPGVTHEGRDAQTDASRLEMAGAILLAFLAQHVPPGPRPPPGRTSPEDSIRRHDRAP